MSPERPTEIDFPEFEEMVPTQPPRLIRQDAVYIIESESESENENESEN
jgi:hypothetical protein